MQMNDGTTNSKVRQRYPSGRSLDEVGPSPVPSGDPQFRDDAHLAIRRPDKRHSETQDGLIDGGVRPAPRLAVLGSQDVGRSEVSVIDAEPAQVIDRREEVGVVLLVGGHEYYIQRKQQSGLSVFRLGDNNASSTAERRRRRNMKSSPCVSLGESDKNLSTCSEYRSTVGTQR